MIDMLLFFTFLICCALPLTTGIFWFWLLALVPGIALAIRAEQEVKDETQ